MRLDGFGLFVDDMAKMIRFYKDVLGFEIKEEENTSNVYLVKDGTLFLLYGRNDFEKMTNRRYEYIKGLNGHFEMALYVDTFEEVDEAYKKAVENGATSVLEPELEPWGQRTCYIADPEGNLIEMRQFYLTFPNGYALRSELSWTHYRLLMRVENENAREFYMQEAVKSQWSTRQLERQINSFFYERLLSSKNKEQVAEEIQTLEPAKKPEDVIRDPYVLEFLGLKSNDDFYESDLEQALITHLQKFLLELGRGFSFVARQKRITFDGRHFRIDLVFYNYILKCFVLIDLKVGDLTHQDLGQMQMYVHYYERELMNEGDNPPIGIVLCADKSESVVKYTLPENETQIFASKYKLYLPSEEELLRELKQEYQALESIKALEENSGSED